MPPDTTLTLWHWCASLLGIAANAAATLPFMAALALILGRRGHAAFCLRGAGALAGLALWLSAAWPILIVADAFVQLSLTGNAPLVTRLTALLTPAGAGISTSVALWLVGALCVWFGRRACARTAATLPSGVDSYTVRAVGVPLTTLLLAAGCALGAFALRNWPFAGLPADMGIWRAASAVGKHACRAYFAALTSGGAVGLLLAAAVARQQETATPLPTATETVGGVRWCAFWAVAGCLPQSLERWGLALGGWLRGGAPVPANPHAALFQLVALVLLTLALAAWAAILVARNPLRRLPLAPAGLVLLFLAASVPWTLALLVR